MVRSELVKIFTFCKNFSVNSPGNQFLICGIFLLTGMVTLSSVRYNIFANVLDFANIRQIWIGEVEQQLNVTISPPTFEECSTVLDCSFGMGSPHSKVIDAFLIFFNLCLISEVQTRCILSAKMFFITKSHTASTWLVFLVILKTELVAMVTHAVLTQMSNIFVFVVCLVKLSQ